MLEVLQYGICAARVGVVYAHILPDEPTPLKWWFDILAHAAEWPVWKWFAYPLGYCAQCCSGHIALWGWLTLRGFAWGNVPAAIVSASIAIILAPKIIRLYEWKK